MHFTTESGSTESGSTETSCTITFNANGGSITTTTQSVKAGTATKLKSATELGLNRENYTFAGWAKSSDAAAVDYADAAEVTLVSNLTLYALWIAKSSTGSGSTESGSTETSCTITFNANGGSITTTTQSVKAGTATKLKSATELGLNRENYTFAGWATKSDATEAEYNDAAEVTLTANLTLYAVWTENACTITFNANGGTITTATQIVKSGAKSKLKSATELGLNRTGYEFAGWATKSDATTAEYTDSAEATLTDNLTLFALWIKLCTITFDANGGNITIATQVVKSGVPTKLKSAAELGLYKTNYKFIGWNKSTAVSSSSGGLYKFISLFRLRSDYNDEAEVTLTDDITLCAQWTEKICTVTFDANGGTITTSKQMEIAGVAATLKTATELGLNRTNYAFVGWATKSDATTAEYADGAEVTLTDNLTLYALWTEKTCTITFDANGGTITTATQTVKAGIAAALKTATELGLSRRNYKFAGWATKSGATTAEYADGAEVTLSDNLTLYAIWNELPVNEQPLTLEFINSGTITITDRWSSLKYSINGGDLTYATYSITVAAGDKVCFYAQNSENNGSINQTISCDADCYIYGNIMSLVTLTENGDWNPLETTLFGEYSFNQLFYKNCHIKNHASKKLILPATKLTSACYCEMFMECSSLTTAPELPAETLAVNCYDSMFDGCTRLTTAPELPAETLAEKCYYSMFDGCTRLTTAPELPAETLADGCYYVMFYGCTSLTTAPELPAETLAVNCYGFMFYGCTSLTTAPSLPAETLAECCYSSMFSGCTSLTTAPSLPAETLADGCYFNMFYGCTSLTTAPSLPAETLADGCYCNMFAGCTSLTTAPELKATTLAEYCYASMFSGCTSLNYVKCLATNINSTYCTDEWLEDVSTSGTFVKAKDMASWGSGVSGIPSGWTVEEAE